MDIVSCSNVTRADNIFCCDPSMVECCDKGIGQFELHLTQLDEATARWDETATRFTPVEQSTSTNTVPTSSQTTTDLPGASTSATRFGTLNSHTSEVFLIGTFQPMELLCLG